MYREVIINKGSLGSLSELIATLGKRPDVSTTQILLFLADKQKPGFEQSPPPCSFDKKNLVPAVARLAHPVFGSSSRLAMVVPSSAIMLTLWVVLRRRSLFASGCSRLAEWRWQAGLGEGLSVADLPGSLRRPAEMLVQPLLVRGAGTLHLSLRYRRALLERGELPDAQAT